MKIEVGLNDGHGGFYGPLLSVEARRDDGDQHIGIVPDPVGVDCRFIDLRMVVQVVLHLVLKGLFLFQVNALRGKDIRFACGICTYSHGVQQGLRQRDPGLHTACGDQEKCAQRQGQKGRRMPADGPHDFCRGFACFFNSLFCILCGVVCLFALSGFDGGILTTDSAFLLPPGERIAGEPRVFLLPFGFKKPDVGAVQFLFRFLYLAVAVFGNSMSHVIAGLKDGFPHVISLQRRIRRRVVILIGSRGLPVQLVSCVPHSFLYGMGKPGRFLFLGLFKLQLEGFFLLSDSR